MSLNLARAQKAELQAYCVNTHGLDPSKAEEMSRDDLLEYAKTGPNLTKPTLDMQAEDDGVPRVQITIHGQDGEGGEEDVPVGVNGKVFQIKRNVPVMVPPSVVEVLNHAVQTQFIPQKDGSMKTREFRRISFSVGA